MKNFNADELRKQLSENLTSKGKTLVTKVIKLNNLQAGKTISALRGLVRNGGLVAVEGKNSIKITDSPEFVSEMIRLIKKLDNA